MFRRRIDRSVQGVAIFQNPAGNHRQSPGAPQPPARRTPGSAFLLAAVCGFATLACAAQSIPAPAAPAPPSPPQVGTPAPSPAPPAANPCQIKQATVGAAYAAVAAVAQAAPAVAGSLAATASAAAIAPPASPPQAPDDAELVPCSAVSPLLNLPMLKKLPLINWYARFLDGPQVKPMTPKEKAWLAVRDVADPFNAITILGSSAIAVATNSHSAYGPGFPGWGRYVGVSYSQDMTGEFFGTFLIPSIVHQDPHYHRMPQASIKRRIAHVLYQVVWTQGDDGKGMINYADLVGFAIDDEIGNLYVPGQETNLPHSAERYATGLATAPIDNAITEFLPDIARKIHIRIVLIQQIINQVANKDATISAP